MPKFLNPIVRLLPIVGFVVVAVVALTAHAEISPDVKTLSEDELGSLYGGFTLPDGIDINVGIDNQIFVNGKSIGDAQFTLNGNTVQTSSTGRIQIQGSGGVTTISQLNAAGPTVIQNTANYLTLDQVRTITVDVTNYTKANLQAVNTIGMMQAELINGLRNGIH